MLNILSSIEQPTLGFQIVRWTLTGLYLLIMVLVSIYGLHRYYLTWLYYRSKKHMPRKSDRFAELPMVTVQLPMFNERFVAERIIEAACHINWPKDRLQIQVLDDSTDDSAQVAEACCRRMTEQGFDVEYRHRTNRHGYKAGALDEGMATAKGDLIAIFDADFVPPENILKRTIHYFTDPGVGMVQTCWDHLNRTDSILTRSQAIFLDGHFLIEHTARNRSGRWMNFNGTAGIWRRQAIDTAGGWQHDTLTEDVDLSYRAQLKGWRFIYLPRVKCPAELPPEITAFKSQQHRWTKGSIQSAFKLLPTILNSDAPLSTKIEAFFHLTSPMVYLYVTLMTLLFFPAFFVNIQPFERGTWAGTFFGISMLMMATVSAGAFYTASQKERRVKAWRTIVKLPILMSIGIGISLNNARGVLEALCGHQSGFVRTPKYNADAKATGAWRQNAGRIRLPASLWMPLLELFMGCYMSVCIFLACTSDDPRHMYSIPFLVLFAAGYFYVGIGSMKVYLASLTSLRPAAAG